MLKSGLSLNEVARRIHCAASSVMRWHNAWRQRGANALRLGSSPGRPPKLKSEQRRRWLRLLLRGPLAHGYNSNVWTTARIAELIRREFGVKVEGGGSCLRIPTPAAGTAALLKALDIHLPEALPHSDVRVVTRKKLPPRRKPR